MAFPPKKKPGLDVMIGVGAPRPPKGMMGAPKFPGADAASPDSGDSQSDDEKSGEVYFHCPACGTKCCVSPASDDSDSGDDMSAPDQSADQGSDQDYGQ